MMTLKIWILKMLISQNWSTNAIILIMEYLKEDGSLDVERIDNLPLEEYEKVIGALTQEQYRDYVSKQPINESIGPIRVVEVDYTLEDELARGGVIAEDYINHMKKLLEEKMNNTI